MTFRPGVFRVALREGLALRQLVRKADDPKDKARLRKVALWYIQLANRERRDEQATNPR